MLWSRFVNKKQGANKAQRKVETLSQKLSAEIITENYRIVFNHAENVRFIEILAYPKSI